MILLFRIQIHPKIKNGLNSLKIFNIFILIRKLFIVSAAIFQLACFLDKLFLTLQRSQIIKKKRAMERGVRTPPPHPQGVEI